MKLHIGCGEKFLLGFKHMDIIEHPHIDYAGNAGDLSFLKAGSVDEIYACHVLEHFNRNETNDVLSEWSRVLRSGGTLRISVPDFGAIAAEYAANNDLDSVLGLLYGGQNYKYNFHYQAYDFNRLESLLEKAGFTNVCRYNWQEFLPADYDNYSRAYLPHMDFQNGRLMSLNIAAAKG
ncbi:MAG: methyltransferase domain-containing protein [Oscillospiraceae bacterium]|jgi:predicted SAM-dependent methyltransferase|nr:methyltransferase domain-containing protein [Oscillospiraceae bacterium]